MASALMAFVQGLAAEQEAPVATQPAVENDDDVLEDSGREEAPATLLAVAQQQQQQQAAKATANAKALAAMAAEVDREERARVQQALAAVAGEVREEQQRAVAAALQEAAAEQYAADEFEAEEAAQTLAQKPPAAEEAADDGWEADTTSKTPKTPKKPKKTETKTPRTMRDKLSAFQGRTLPLTLTQRQLLLATLADDAPRPSTRRAVNMEAISALATDRRRQQQQQRKPRAEFAKLDDNRHCRFRPRLRAGGGSREAQADDEDGGGGGNGSRGEDLVRRMEAAERARTEGLRRTREEKLYLARVDKKECPSCGSAQSYAELSQKRTKCPNCGATYRRRIAWSAIADDFLARLETYVAARQQAREPRTEAPGGPASARTWPQVRDEFLGRVQRDLARRELSKAAVWREMAAEWTFRPAVTRRAQAQALGGFDERLRRDLDARRQRQEQYARLQRALAAAPAAQTTAKAPGSKAAYAPSAPFQERLRLDLQRRREREREQQQQQQRKPPARQLPRAC